MTYTVHKLPGLAFAVTDQNGKSWCVCDRQEDAERIAGVMNDYDEMLAARRHHEGREPNMTKPAHTPGPYRVLVQKHPPFNWRVVGKDDTLIAERLVREDAERIAYCLTVVEQSEETARRDEAKS